MAIKQFNVQLSEVNVEDFYRYHPGKNLSYHLDLLLGKYVAQHKHTPEEYAEMAVQELKEEIE